jgi:hypothetical protein
MARIMINDLPDDEIAKISGATRRIAPPSRTWKAAT